MCGQFFGLKFLVRKLCLNVCFNNNEKNKEIKNIFFVLTIDIIS